MVKHKKSILLLFLSVVFCLSSCGWSEWGNIHRRNYFVEGEFSGVNSRNTDETFYLTVSEISKEEYEVAQGVNVIDDIFKKKYFSLDMYFLIGQSEEKNPVVFSHLKDYGTPISYRDANRYNITSFVSEEDFDFEKEPAYTFELPQKDGHELNAGVFFYQRKTEK